MAAKKSMEALLRLYAGSATSGKLVEVRSSAREVREAVSVSKPKPTTASSEAEGEEAEEEAEGEEAEEVVAIPGKSEAIHAAKSSRPARSTRRGEGSG